MHYLEKVVEETQEKEKKINLNRISTSNGDEGNCSQEDGQDLYHKPSPYINSNNDVAPPIADQMASQ